MNNHQENNATVAYKVISVLFVGLVVSIIYFDISEKYFKQGVELFSVDSPLLFPFLIFITLLISFIFEIWTVIKDIPGFFVHSKNESKEVSSGSKGFFKGKEAFHILSFVVISLIYVYILPKLHFIFATSLYMFCIMMVINERDRLVSKLVKSLITTAVTIPIVYYVFYEIFEVILP